MALLIPPQDYNFSDMMQIMQQIDTRLQNLERALTDKDYTVTNNTSTRTIDATAATLDDTRKVLSTLIEDLQLRGRLPGANI